MIMKGGGLGIVACNLLNGSGGVHSEMRSVAQSARRGNIYLNFGLRSRVRGIR